MNNNTVSLRDIKELNSELENAVINFIPYHDQMRLYRNYFKFSAFYQSQAGDPVFKNSPYANLLRVFAEKNIEYTSSFPTLKVPTTGSDTLSRESASVREKILYAVWGKSGGPLLQKKWSYDGTIHSVAVAETGFDFKNRCVFVRRYDPRKCFWQISNDNDQRVIAFWAVFAITQDEAFRRYGVTPTSDPLSGLAKTHTSLTHIDGKNWFTMAIRWDEKTRTAWIGDKIIEEPHNHMMGDIPIDICQPIEEMDEEHTSRGGFYLEPLIPLQAELNDTVLRRSRIVRRMSSPLVWVRGVAGGRNLDAIESKMSQAGGGFLPMTKDGEAGLLQLKDTGMLNEHQTDIILQMTRLAGYGNAAFGESVGANTSGDALAMYFNATQRKIETQMISWTSFYQSINTKILRLYDKLLKTGEQVSLSGYSPHGVLMPLTDPAGKPNGQYGVQRGAYGVTFDKSAIAGNYNSVVTPPNPTPKSEIEWKRLIKEAADSKFLSRTTAYEEWGLLSPEDELKLLEQEQTSPILNSDGVGAILNNQPPVPPVGSANGTTAVGA